MTDKSQPYQFARETGCPFANAKHSMTAGPHGPMLIQDTEFLEKLGHFVREKIPARNVHALGCGAYGTFTVTNDITKYTKAKLFSKVGKKTDLFVRMSGIFTEQGDPDTTRDPRGFAIKFYTEDGNWDLLGINTPVFSVRDLKPGPDNVHAFKRDPRSGLWNATQFWDYVANHPEGLHQVLMLYTDRIGTPMSFRKMNAYGCHTFSFINEENKVFWVKFHLISQQGAAGLSAAQAKLIAGEDPNFLARDFKTAIEKGQFPRWKLACQIMSEEEGYKHKWAFDATKVWKHKDYPLIDIGYIELNRNPINYFSEVEQVAFGPATLVPGIGLSPDKLLQGRLLIYDDTQRHRIGANYKQLPINRPNGKPENMTQYYGGPMNYEVQNKYPHYWPASSGNCQPQLEYIHPAMKCDGPAGFYPPEDEYSDEDIFGQCRDFLRILKDTDLAHLIENLAVGLEKVDDKEVLEKQLQALTTLDKQFGTSVRSLLEARRIGAIKKSEGELLLQQLNLELLGTTVPERK